jgi:hypothetical protein
MSREGKVGMWSEGKPIMSQFNQFVPRMTDERHRRHKLIIEHRVVNKCIITVLRIVVRDHTRR